ncbi:hypothetical protein MPTK1_2g12510 [Marchantia polymorpha subsp. ruderalis]|uniref:Uncharacterized protein n=1 Tax=Marchantia polymorpha TaxID=3197 RepID=A0A2R6XB02_MARPO|nr:hypothetical protein MARPO_0026s0120 [Marchantia polymorpha]BBN02071.1 hypothetical protein Mp_2g12510 [Marchantia polymorpha subsp. ruderalis]|eukprot:PTQ43249.1 hypothetical protein MARPO_0026s0120 [Marchantia polymorpha]
MSTKSESLWLNDAVRGETELCILPKSAPPKNGMTSMPDDLYPVDHGLRSNMLFGRRSDCSELKIAIHDFIPISGISTFEIYCVGFDVHPNY